MNYLVSAGLATEVPIDWSDNNASGASLGDLIAYDWNGGADGTIDHVAVVTGFNADGYPLVSQHSPARTNRYWSWDPGKGDWIQYADSGSHGEPKAYLIRITY